MTIAIILSLGESIILAPNNSSSIIGIPNFFEVRILSIFLFFIEYLELAKVQVSFLTHSALDIIEDTISSRKDDKLKPLSFKSSFILVSFSCKIRLSSKSKSK